MTGGGLSSSATLRSNTNGEDASEMERALLLASVRVIWGRILRVIYNVERLTKIFQIQNKLNSTVFLNPFNKVFAFLTQNLKWEQFS